MGNLAGFKIDRYKILSRLGKGSAAVAYRAQCPCLNSEVAIKLICTAMFPPAILDQILKRFERDAIAMTRLKHPNIVTVYDFGEFGNSLYLVMEFLPGGTLRDRMGKTIPHIEASRLLEPVADALAYAHSENIIHMGVKPANILFTATGEPILSDLGISHLLCVDNDNNLNANGMKVDTPAYIAPEQWEGKVCPAIDIYALGVVLFEMLTGRLPYEATTSAELIEKIATLPLPDPRKILPDIPKEVVAVVQTALQRQPGKCFAKMADFRAALSTISGSCSNFILPHMTTPLSTYLQNGISGRNDKGIA